jgi:hypothetical protein
MIGMAMDLEAWTQKAHQLLNNGGISKLVYDSSFKKDQTLAADILSDDKGNWTTMVLLPVSDITISPCGRRLRAQG